MKINRKCQEDCYIELGCIAAGSVVEFKKSFAEKHFYDDPFLVLDVCASYFPYKQGGSSSDKCGVVNLRTGALAYVSKERHVRRINAELTVK